MWGFALGVAAVLAAMGVYDWRVRRRRGGTPKVDGFTARSSRIRDEGRAGAPNDLRDGHLGGGPYGGSG
jgi:hypothetical protein